MLKLTISVQLASQRTGEDTLLICPRPVWHCNRLTDICTNTCYLTNMRRLYKFVLPDRAPSTFAAMIMLALSGDIALNPGPTFTCGVCQLVVSWSHKAVACDNCSVWVHKSCASLDSATYDQLENLSWKCYCCRSVNVSSFVYNAYNVNVSNSFAPLAGILDDDGAIPHQVVSPSGVFEPKLHSSTAGPNRLHGNESSTSFPCGSSTCTQSLPTTVNNLRIAVVNANSVKGKRAELAELCNSTQPDILVVSETKLDGSMNPSEFFPKNYDTSIHRNRTSCGGGVLIATKKSIVADEVVLKAGNSGEIVCARVALTKASPMYVCAYYRPPSDTSDSLDTLQLALEELDDLIRSNPRSSIVVAGDFNARDIDWDRLVPASDCKKKGLCSKLISILGDAQLQQLQRENTREDAVLDLFCTNNPSLVKAIDTIPGISDHDGIILVDMYLKAQINKKPQRRIPVWSKANWEAMKIETTDFCKEFMHGCEDRSIEANWKLFSDHLKCTQSKHIPSKLTSTRYNVPWLSGKVKKMCRKKRHLYRKAKKSDDPVHKSAFKKLQNETRDALRAAHWKYVNGVLMEGLERGDTKPFYGYVKSQQQDSQGVSPLRAHGQLFSDATSKARMLSEQFKSVFTKDDPTVPTTRLPGPHFPNISPVTVEPHGVEKLLLAINPRKASGPDEIPARILQCLAAEIAPALSAIFSQSLQTAELPTQWKKAWITPVFKKGGRADPANYRPVSLTLIACKLLEHIVCSHIRKHTDRYNILGEANHGFRAKHSTETQLLLTTHDMLKNRDMGKQLDVVILDFSKAFDTVPHRRLLGKLEHYGINENLLQWIEAFLGNRTQSVLVDGVRSKEEAVMSGVPQGTVLGPLMFLLYINDMPSHVHSETRCRLFADDTLLYRVVETIADQVQLQQDLRNLEHWAAEWGMVFNPSKCYVMTINKGMAPKTHFYELCGTVLQSVDHEKYLGVILSQDMKWSAHTNHISSKANQKLGFIKRNLKGSPQELKCLAYISLVRSSMEYASSVWDPHLIKDIDSLERIQRRAARWITNTYDRSTSVTVLLQELKLEPLEERRRFSRLAFLYKILNEHVAVPPDKLDLVLNDRPVRGTVTQQRFRVLRCKSTEYQKSFAPRTITEWNSLSRHITSAASVSSFRSQLTASAMSLCP